MKIVEYSERQHFIVKQAVALILKLLSPFKAARLSRSEWGTLLDVVYPHVEKARRKSAELGREFFDSERQEHAPEADLYEIFLAEYKKAWFEEAMEPSRDKVSQPGVGDDDLADFAARAAKEIENGGRRTILRAVDNDPVLKGWARVATGRETCGFCLMLVSRGPVYTSAENAGLDLTDTEATNAFAKTGVDQLNTELMNELGADDLEFDFLTENMVKWHPGCDCKVVPVFDLKRWPGRSAHKRAVDMWKEASAGRSGKDALNALRRAIADGDIDENDFSIAA